MPKVILPNIGVRTSVMRPVVLDVARQLLTITGLPENTPIQFPERDETAFQPGSTLDLAPDTNSFGADTKLFISVEETPVRDRLLSTATYYDDARWIYVDPEVKAFMRPIYSHQEIAINIRYRATDKDAAEAWRNDIKSRLPLLRDVYVHTVSYSYLIPEELIERIAEIHRMREAVAPYNQTWEEYVKEKFSNKLRQVVTQAGTDPVWAVAENQSRTQGVFDFDEGPEEGSKENDVAAWTITVTYKFRFDKPIETYLEYPLIIHNQLIKKEYRQTAMPVKVEDEKQLPSMSVEAMQAFEAGYNIDWRGRLGVSIPVFDEFIPSRNSILPDTARIFTGLALIDPENPRDLLKLTELGRTYKLDPSVEAFLKTEYPWLCKPTLSIFNVSVYRDQYMLALGSYEVTPDLIVRLKEDPDLRSQYHVRFSLYERPRLLPTEAKLRLRESCSLTRMLLLTLDPFLEQKGLLPTCMIGNYMSAASFNAAVEEIDKRFDVHYTGQVYQWNTVMTLIVGVDSRN